jgi:hypothetical protein
VGTIGGIGPNLLWLTMPPMTPMPRHLYGRRRRSLHSIFQPPLGASGQSHRRECDESRTTEALDGARPNRSNMATFLGPKHGRRGERHCRFKKFMEIEQILLVVGAAGIEPATSPV